MSMYRLSHLLQIQDLADHTYKYYREAIENVKVFQAKRKRFFIISNMHFYMDSNITAEILACSLANFHC